jgi:outer membrane lipoprotein-sorting protein
MLKGLALLLPLALAASAPAPAPSAEDIGLTPGEVLDRIDDLYRGESSAGTMTMRIVTDRYERELTLNMWTKGQEQTLVRILQPKKERGVATLRNGNEMWNYLPKVDRTVKLNSAMMSKSWLGSDFTYDDFIKETRMREDYTYDITFFGERDGAEQIELTCIPREEAAVVWGKVVVVLLKEDYMPLRIDYYDEDIELARVMEFSEVRDFGERRLPATMVVTRPNKPGQSTTVTYLELEFDLEVPDDTFSLRALRD